MTLSGGFICLCCNIVVVLLFRALIIKWSASRVSRETSLWIVLSYSS